MDFFDRLPDGPIIEILKNLTPVELQKTCLTNKKMAGLLQNNLLWKNLCERELTIRETTNLNLISEYKKHYEEMRKKYAQVIILFCHSNLEARVAMKRSVTCKEFKDFMINLVITYPTVGGWTNLKIQNKTGQNIIYSGDGSCSLNLKDGTVVTTY